MGSVLLLNVTYEPLAVVSVRRALALLTRGRVDAASEETIAIQSLAGALQVPTVIRLQRYVRVPSRKAAWSRRGVLRRDNYRCGYCGVRSGEGRGNLLLSKPDFTVDHILPRSRGGKNTWGNTICACPSCNQRKGNRTPHEAGLTLLWEPKTPRVDYLIASGEIPTAWKIYLEL
jgi:5-methylcytosine-specific restriction endonuclease McrA